MSTVGYGSALYYPYIHLTDDNWLKAAALYYDGISRIVPPTARPVRDSQSVQLLKNELNFVTDLDPRDEAEEIAHDFLQFARKHNVIPCPVRVRPKYASGLQARRVKFRLYAEKFASTTLHALAEMGIISEDEGHRLHLDLDPLVAAVYLTFLAERMAERRKIPLVTDDPKYHSVLQQFEFDSTDPAPGRDCNVDMGYALASIVLRTVVPKGLSGLSVKRIVTFRRKHEAERQQFFEAIKGLTKDIPKIEDQESLEACLNHHRKTIEVAVEDLERALQGVKIKCAAGLLALSAPPWLIAASHFPSQMLVGAGITLFAGIKTGEYYQEYNRLRKGSPWSYVLSLRSRLKPSDLVKDLVSTAIM